MCSKQHRNPGCHAKLLCIVPAISPHPTPWTFPPSFIFIYLGSRKGFCSASSNPRGLAAAKEKRVFNLYLHFRGVSGKPACQRGGAALPRGLPLPSQRSHSQQGGQPVNGFKQGDGFLFPRLRRVQKCVLSCMFSREVICMLAVISPQSLSRHSYCCFQTNGRLPCVCSGAQGEVNLNA